MKEAPSCLGKGVTAGQPATQRQKQQPTFSRLYLKGTAKPTLDTAFSLLSLEIKRLNTTKADSLKGYIQTQVWVLLFFSFFCLFPFFKIPFLKRHASILEKVGGGNKNQDNLSTLIFIREGEKGNSELLAPLCSPGAKVAVSGPSFFCGCRHQELMEGEWV